MLTRPCFRFPLPCGAGVDRQREAKEKKEAEEKARKEVRVIVLLLRPPLRPTARIGCGAFRLPPPPLSQFSLLGFGLPEWYAGADTLACFLFRRRKKSKRKRYCDTSDLFRNETLADSTDARARTA